MRLQPYVKVDATPFSARRGDVERHFGPPHHARANSIGLVELDYGNTVFRFQCSSGRLEEVTRRTPVLYLTADAGAVDLPFGALAPYVQTHDPQAFRRARFVISPRFGLALVPDEPDWVTALARHCIATWRDLRG